MALGGSIKAPRVLPTIADMNQLQSYLNTWRSKLNQKLRTTTPAPPPYNFTATAIRGAIQLSWSSVATGQAVKGLGQNSGGPDGYEILRSASGDFTSDLVTIPVRNINQTSYTDSIDGKTTTCSYRIHTTSGTPANPHSISGPDSGVVKTTSIDATDIVSTPTTVRDQYLNDNIRATARYGRYRTGL